MEKSEPISHNAKITIVNKTEYTSLKLEGKAFLLVNLSLTTSTPLLIVLLIL